MNKEDLLLLIATLNKRQAIQTEDHLISLENDPQTNQWRLSTSIATSEKKHIGRVLRDFTSKDFLQRKTQGAELKINREKNSIDLTQTSASKPSKDFIAQFSLAASEWKELFTGFDPLDDFD